MHHQPALRLHLSFNEEQLLGDLDICLSQSWSRHFHERDYAGDWSSIALRSSSGNPKDIHAHPGVAYINTALLDTCEYFTEVLNTFRCPLEGVRLLQLSPGSVIKEHTDPGTSYKDGVLRIHIPVTTNPGVDFRIGGERITMLPGECWYADFGLPHSVRNDGNSSRVHLVIDALRNDWTDELLARAGYHFEAERISRLPSREKIERMIEELSAQGTPFAHEWIAKLRAEHGLAP